MVLKEAVPHTPGPWKADRGVDDDPTRCFVVQDIEGAPSFLIAEIGNGAPGDCLDTEMANARLIAAAPQLLAACHLARLWLANCVPTTGIDGPRPLPALSAAIAKAEGR